MSADASDPHAQPTETTLQLDAIVDAVCQGRLTPADVAGLSADELDAIYAIGQMRFETGQLEQAISMWAALVSLDPYQARAWRALGIGHHHSGAMRQAGAAYAAALYLEPNHAITAVYAAEVHMLMGEQALAEHYARIVRRSQDEQAITRLRKLGSASAAKQTAEMTRPSQADRAAGSVADETQQFCLTDGRTLPLANSCYPPAGETDETTLVYDLAHAAGMQVNDAPSEQQDLALGRGSDSQQAAGLSPPLRAVAMPHFAAPKERTITGLSQHVTRILPEATAARRMGRLLTEELTVGPDSALEQELTQAQMADVEKDL